MRDPSFYVSGLLEMHRIGDAIERRATWRQSMAALARASSEEASAPLDGLHPEVLAQSVRAALHMGIVDDLDWLAPTAAGPALYELAAALPLGPEQRELGRRVLARLLPGSADVFVAIAKRMALGTSKALGSSAIRTRIALVNELPLSHQVQDGALALAIASRRDLARDWIFVPATGSLPARRLAARILERAAREAARRAAQGDEHALKAFRVDSVAQAWSRLLSDRESLVWRHVAIARGLLAPWLVNMRDEIDHGLDPQLSPTEWRRAAASVAAYVAVAPNAGVRRAITAMSRGILERDPGCAGAFAWGLTRGAEAEPEAAWEVIEALFGRVPWETAEASVDLVRALGPSAFSVRVTERSLEVLRLHTQTGPSDDGLEALKQELLRDLGEGPDDARPLRDQLLFALEGYATEGARLAHQRARNVLRAAGAATTLLTEITVAAELERGEHGERARKSAFAVLRDLDLSLFESGLLHELLHLGNNEDARAGATSLDTVHEQVSDWILERARRPRTVRELPHATIEMRRLRTLLHLVDTDVADANEDSARIMALRKRWLRVARVLLERFDRDSEPTIRRTVVATLARVLDALVRVNACDLSDVLLVGGRSLEDPAEFETLAEASMNPDLEQMMRRFASFVRRSKPKPAPARSGDRLSSIPPAATERDDLLEKLAAFEELFRDLVEDASGRVEALRAAFAKMHASLYAIATAGSLRALCTERSGEPDVIEALEIAIGVVSQLAMGARARLEPETVPAANQPGTPKPLSFAVSQVLLGNVPKLQDAVISDSNEVLTRNLPRAIGRLVTSVLWTICELPIDLAQRDSVSLKVIESLPAWLPPRRTIGGFYVVRPLGTGGVSSVFIVKRIEERHEKAPELFALKVPEYSATAARSVSESDFLTMFRDEASALLALPGHPNLARFVTFDAGAKPKPILVMELVEGTTLEKLIESRTLDVPRAMRILDDVLAGLAAMHQVRVAHLDIKPSNVVLRNSGEGVLVDFGLAGRHIRPGCATGSYGAPEVWVTGPEATPEPMGADIYAFACTAFEALTGQVLFNADTELQLIARHLGHDGDPPIVSGLAEDPILRPLAELLRGCLRRDPGKRPHASDVRTQLRQVAVHLASSPWPIQKINVA